MLREGEGVADGGKSRATTRNDAAPNYVETA